ncbi:MAG TPA: DEAD/DEAH box helicase family protein [Nitrososphaera sp.]|nr:DEAD/DEAH box helicase family protein [Nitrososphaera sp.]
MLKATLIYDKGTIVIKGLAHIPFATPDPRGNVLRAQALYYVNIVDYLKRSGIEFTDHVFANAIASPDFQAVSNGNDSTLTNGNELPATSPIMLRDYQKRALESWIRAGMRGSVVLPTGSGKTIVGIKAIEKVNACTLIVVPTLDLMDQWTGILAKHFQSTKIGNLGGGTDDIQPITVATYDSAYLRAPLLGDTFFLVVFDEVHHLAAPRYRTIAEQMAAPYRLGLTATIEREDELHKDLPRLIGDVIYRASIETLAKKRHLAPYEIERRKVELLPEELKEYRESMSTYRQCLSKIGKRTGGGSYKLSFEKLIVMSGKNPVARRALLARNRATKIALNSKAKIEELKEILAENQGKKTIIFTQHNSLVYQISDKFLIPFITHKTKKEERQDVLKGFKEGRYMAIVTSKVLDEGVDVPDAELGIIVSGTGSGREFIQRLGRLLRPKPRVHTTIPGARNDNDCDKRAKLIEIVSSETKEETITSAKRKRALRSIGQYDWSGRDGEEELRDDDNTITSSSIVITDGSELRGDHMER